MDGKYNNAREAQASLIPEIVPAALIMALILVGLFNSYRKPLIIALIIPFAMIGVTLNVAGVADNCHKTWAIVTFL